MSIVSPEDLKALKDTISAEVEEDATSSRGESSAYPLLYPRDDGKYILRLLYNVKGKIVQRRIIRHQSAKTKCACLQSYGYDCPVCEAITEIESVLGKESGVFSKYGYKTRGICYAQVVDIPASYQTGEHPIKPGDVVLLMYPKSLYTSISKILIDSGDYLGKIVAENDSIPIVLERSTKPGGFPDYSIALYPYGSSKAYESDEKYDEVLSEIPNILETICPQYPTDDVMKAARAMADTIKEEYLKSTVVNPSDDGVPFTVEQTETEKAVNNVSAASIKETINAVVDETPEISEPQLPDSTESTATASGDNPPCFGNYRFGERKCLLCMSDMQCKKACGKA